MPIISANFTPDGSQVIMTGRRNYFYSLELESGNTLRVTGIRGKYFIKYKVEMRRVLNTHLFPHVHNL